MLVKVIKILFCQCTQGLYQTSNLSLKYTWNLTIKRGNSVINGTRHAYTAHNLQSQLLFLIYQCLAEKNFKKFKENMTVYQKQPNCTRP